MSIVLLYLALYLSGVIDIIFVDENIIEEKDLNSFYLIIKYQFAEVSSGRLFMD